MMQVEGDYDGARVGHLMSAWQMKTLIANSQASTIDCVP